MRLDQLRARVGDGSVRTVLLALPDMQGRLKGKRYAAGYFLERLAADSTEVCAYLLATDVDMRPLDGYDLASWSSGYSDLRLVPDLASARMLPGDGGCVLVLGDVLGPDGLPVPVAPRQMLRRELEGLAALGLTARVGLETEFTVYRGAADEGPWVPVSAHNLDYALSHSRPLAGFLRGLEESLTGAGLPLEAVKTEAAAGQVEITFRYGEPMAAADGHVLFKHLAREVADGLELTPTFMAAPETGVGNGLHVHVSLWRGEEPVFPGGADPDGGAGAGGHGGMSALAGQAVAGLVDAVPQLMPLLLPHVNSYKRLVAGSFAPTRMAWGPDNRTCAVRVVGHGRGLHLELRVAGADANPYLLTAAVLAACRHGIGQGLKPPAPVTGNAYEAAETPEIPAGPTVALAAFRDGPLARELLGDEAVRHYARAAQVEIDALAMVVTDAERRRGFTRA